MRKYFYFFFIFFKEVLFDWMCFQCCCYSIRSLTRAVVPLSLSMFSHDPTPLPISECDQELFRSCCWFVSWCWCWMTSSLWSMLILLYPLPSISVILLWPVVTMNLTLTCVNSAIVVFVVISSSAACHSHLLLLSCASLLAQFVLSPTLSNELLSTSNDVEEEDQRWD